MTRIALFTDTLTDINGVARFVAAVAAHAPDVHVLACTRRDAPFAPNIHTTLPRFACRMPGYATLDLALPDVRTLTRRLDVLNPEVVHVSTPGPVGLLGRHLALRRGLPLIGTYHTDFPAYVEHLLGDDALTAITACVLRRFYAIFDRVLVRSSAAVPRVAAIGVAPERIVTLQPGIDTTRFDARCRNNRVWIGLPGARSSSVKALYVGRLSVEKNLPALARLWPRVRAGALARGIDAQLILVGDGPYRGAMEQALAGEDAVFLGFREGDELSTIYASSDLFVFPSTTDTLGQAVMEAQASGLASVVMDQGGPREIVRDSVTGWVVSTPAEMGAAVLGLLANPERRARMGAAARARLAPMSIARSIEHFVTLHQFNDVVTPKHKPGHALARGPARR